MNAIVKTNVGHANLLGTIKSGGMVLTEASHGYMGSLIEILLQSHIKDEKTDAYIIHLLPALDKDAWPSGSVTGLRARGGFAVDLTWKEGRLSKAVIRSIRGRRCNVRYGAKKILLEMKAGSSVTLKEALD